MSQVKVQKQQQQAATEKDPLSSKSSQVELSTKEVSLAAPFQPQKRTLADLKESNKMDEAAPQPEDPLEQNDISKRVILRARRRYDPATISKGIQDASNNEGDGEKRGGFTLSGSLNKLSLDASLKSVPKTTFDFTANLQSKSDCKPAQPEKVVGESEDKKESLLTRIPCSTLSKEKKFFANRNLFANPMIKPLPVTKPVDELKPKTEIPKQIHVNKMVCENPLSSAMALKEQKDLQKVKADGSRDTRESPVIKSLYEFKGNSKFKEKPKKSFDFSKQDKDEGKRGLTFSSSKKPSNPFQSNKTVNPFSGSGTSNPFANSGQKSLFGNPFSNKQSETPAWLKPKEPEKTEDEDSPLPADEKEKLQSSVQKHFQSQVEKLKVLKGLGRQCPQPCTKANGYLSIEDYGTNQMVVLRTFIGVVIFSGILNKNCAKIKQVETEGKTSFKVKFTVVVLDKERKPQVEHCEAKFLNQDDLNNFVKVYKSKSDK